MDSLSTTLSQIETLVRPYPVLQALIIFAAFILLAMVVDRICSRVLVRLLARVDSVTGNRIVAILHKPIFVTVMLIGFVLASRRLVLIPPVHTVLIGAVGTGLVVLWAVTTHRVFGVSLNAMIKTDRRFSFAHPTTAPMFKNTVAILLFVVGTYGILLTWDINVTGLVASAGIVGLALSFAAQDTLGNLFAGVSILADRPYEIGDYIVLDSGERGEVVHIGLRSTRLLTRDDVGVTIPNGVIAKAKILNEAASPRKQYRIRLKVGVAYGTNVRELIVILTDIAMNHSEVCSNPEPRVRLRAFGDSALVVELLCWIKRPVDRGRITHELFCSVYETFAALGISIPVPQRDIRIKGVLA